MTIKRCDCCGAVFDNPIDNNHIVLLPQDFITDCVGEEAGSYHGMRYRALDMCKDCMVKISAIFNNDYFSKLISLR